MTTYKQPRSMTQDIPQKQQFRALLVVLALIAATWACGGNGTDTPQKVLETKRTGITIESIAFSPGGALLAANYMNGIIRVWDITTGQQKITLEHEASGISNWSEVIFSPGGKLLATEEGSSVQIWDVTTGKKEITIGGDYSIHSLAFSPDGKFLAAGDAQGRVHLWDVNTGEEKDRLETSSEPITSVAFSSDGTLLAFGSIDGTAYLVDIATGETKVTFNSGEFAVESIDFSPDGKLIATSDRGEENTARLWDIATGEEVIKLRTRYSSTLGNVFFSPDGKYLATGGVVYAQLWDVTTGSRKMEFGDHIANRMIFAVEISPNGKLIAFGDSNGQLEVWSVPQPTSE